MLAVSSRVFRNLNAKTSIPLIIRQFYPHLVFAKELEFHLRSCRFYSGDVCYRHGRKLDGLEYNGRRRNGICIASIPVGMTWICPCIVVLSQSSSAVKFVSTQTSCDDTKVDDHCLNKILSAMENTGLSYCEVCTCIDNLCNNRRFSDITMLLSTLHDKHFYLSGNVYNHLLATTSRENNIELSLQIFRGMLISSSSCSSESYLNLARTFSCTDECTLLLKFVDEISELIFARSTLVLNRMIFAFGECRQADKSLAIFDHMKTLKCGPDLVTYNTVIQILGHIGQVDGMLLQVASMREANIAPNIVTYNTLINNFRRFCRSDLCVTYWKEMENNGIQPDLRTYTAMIDSLGRCGNIEESLSLFDEMRCRRIRPSIYIYRSLIDCLKTMGKLEIAASLHVEMISYMPDLVGPKDFERKKR